MPVAVRCRITHGSSHIARANDRYSLIGRIAACCHRRDVQLLAFGVGDHEIRVVLDGDLHEAELAVLAVRSGTSRAVTARGATILWGDTDTHDVEEGKLPDAIAWAHTVVEGADPLTAPWTSHRDLLGFRHAPFFNAAPVRARVRPEDVHRLAGGGPLPGRPAGLSEAGLDRILRVSAAVLGVPASDRVCFRLFVHLARAQGWRSPDLERALQLTGRRIRQLAAAPEPLLQLAERHLADERLAVVP